MNLFDLDAGAFDHVRPFGDLGFEERIDVGQRYIERDTRRRGDALFHERSVLRLLHLRVQLVDDRLRRLPRRPKADPGVILVAGHAGYEYYSWFGLWAPRKTPQSPNQVKYS